MSITRHSGEAMARSSITGDNVPLRIQSGIEMSVESLGLTTMDCILIGRKQQMRAVKKELPYLKSTAVTLVSPFTSSLYMEKKKMKKILRRQKVVATGKAHINLVPLKFR